MVLRIRTSPTFRRSEIVPVDSQVGELIDAYNEDFCIVKDDDSGAHVGYVTSAFWTPNPESNIALAVLPRTHWPRGTRLKVQIPKGGIVDDEVVRVSFFDPVKDTPKSKLKDRAAHYVPELTLRAPGDLSRTPKS